MSLDEIKALQKSGYDSSRDDSASDHLEEIRQALFNASSSEEEEENEIDMGEAINCKPRFPFFDTRIESLNLYDPDEKAEYDEFMKNVKGVGRRSAGGEKGWS